MAGIHMDLIKNSLRSMHQFLRRNLLSSTQQAVLVGGIIFLAYMVFYWGWTEFYPQPYESFWLRLTGSLLGLGLMLTPYWPESLKPVVPWYWFLTLLYTLPFFFTYSFLMNHANDMSSMALLCGAFLLVLLVDLITLLILLVLGMGLAFVCYYVNAPAFYFSNEHAEALLVMTFLIAAGLTVNYKKSVLQRQRMAGMAAAAGMIAHELRTPLLGIKSGAQALNRYLPLLFEGYHLAHQNGLLKKSIRQSREQQLKGVSDRVVNEINYANTIIDMLLMKAGRENSLLNCTLEPCSMAECLQEAMKRYPFASTKQRESIEWEGDFQFMGSKLLMQHVLFNLIKNALYVIATAQRGTIQIWTKQTEHYNYLFFKDTAKGMSNQQLSRLFDHFYTTTFMGTGIGLSFCKLVMERFDGKIACESEEGQYTTFILTFPRLKI